MRAVAVGLVVFFHLWPNLLPGGYVGVDVFFVISGYLITGLLVRAALPGGRISLLDFYSRRARRLLPAATAVLAATLVGMLVFLPPARWEETATQVAAGALYLQNWVLAWLAVDYLGAENAASPVQHYWSLAIEEQFYLVWPLMMMATIAAARKTGVSATRALVATLGLLFAGSLAASIVLTAANQTQAYFVTHTRLWELALGGLLALSIHRFRGTMQARAAMALAGLAAIFWSAWSYSHATPFPGTAALLPTLGTVLVVIAGDVRIGAFRGLNAGWLRYLGDRSYSIYLWHWPLIAFYSARQDQVGLLDGLGLLALTLVIAHLSYCYIEERYRHPRARGEWRPLGYGLASVLACVLAAGAVQYFIAAQPAAVARPNDPDYPGPAALLAAAPVPDGVKPIPPLARLKRDLPIVYREKCHQDQASAEPISCVLGDPDGTKTVVVAGDSHAAQWIPALDRLSKEQGWKLVTLTKSACAFSRVDVLKAGKPYPSCAEWRENVVARIKELGAATVFTSQSRYDYVSAQAMTQGLRSVWSELTQAGAQVVAIHDTPWMPFQPADCLAGDPKECVARREEVAAKDVFSAAAEGMDAVRVIDLTDGICGPETCEAVVGNIIVWRDQHHMTATYAEALAPFLGRKLDNYGAGLN